MRTLPGVDHDDAFRMIDDPCVSRQPAGPVPVGKNRKPPRQAVPLPFDLRGFDPDEPRLNGVDFHGGQEPVKCADFAMLDHDPLRLNRIMISSFCWSMISGQTLRACPEGKPVPTRRVVARGHAFPDHALSESRPAEKPDSSFRLDVGCLDDRPPSFRFGLLERAQGFGRLLRERKAESERWWPI